MSVNIILPNGGKVIKILGGPKGNKGDKGDKGDTGDSASIDSLDDINQGSSNKFLSSSQLTYLQNLITKVPNIDDFITV